MADAVTPAVERLLVGEAVPTPQPGARDAAPVATAAPRSLDDAVAVIAEALRADRADLTAEQSGNRITFRLHIPDQACAECVMPSSMLVEMLQHRIDIEMGPGLVVELDDPREVAEPGG